MPFYEKGNVRIHYEEAGSGFPLFIIYGGGLNSKVTYANGPFDAFEEFKSEYRCISMDLRNANGGQSTGPLDFEAPWDAHTHDQLSLLDRLGDPADVAVTEDPPEPREEAVLDAVALGEHIADRRIDPWIASGRRCRQGNGGNGTHPVSIPVMGTRPSAGR